MKAVAAVLLVGMLILWAELPTGSAWFCPRVRVTCSLLDPPNECYSDLDCPVREKCCRSYCGMRCTSKPFDTPTSEEGAPAPRTD